MSKNMPQIALDFGAEPSLPSQQGESREKTEPLARQYMAAGVGVRIKSLKNPKAVSGDLFGNGEAPPVEPASQTEPVLAAKSAPPAEAKGAEDHTAGLTEENSLIEMTGEAGAEEEAGTQVEVAIPETATESALPETAAISMENRKATAPRRTERVARTVATAQNAVKSTRGRKSLKQVSAEADLIEIPADEVLFSKQYYTMGEVAGMFRVNQSLLRFWETEFDILQPRKNKKGDRYFRPIDIKNLHLIYHLLRQRKYTIEGAKDFLKKNKKAEERFEAIQRLQEIRAFLQEWKAHINF